MTASIDYVTETRPEDLLSFCKAMADQVRLTILSILDKESFGVLELCEILQLKQPALTHHLKILSDAGLLTRRREGNSIFYSRNHNLTGNFSKLQNTLFEALSSVTLNKAILARKSHLQRQRAIRSEQFFQQNSAQFSANQELVAPVTAYEKPLVAMLNDHQCELSESRAIEVGPGEGLFLPNLSNLFTQVDALDNSDAMLELASKYSRQQQLENVNFIAGDTSAEQLQKQFYDVAVINMVLHHNPSPVMIFQDIFEILKSGASLFISELVTHQQDWVRDACGDIWLGFNAEDLTIMAESVGFNDGMSHYLAQRNGFVVQLREFTKP